MSDLRGKTALVTGAGKRVGRAIAVRLGAAGMRVIVHFRESREGAEETARAIRAAGGDAALVSADLADLDAAARLADEAVATFGSLDLFVASAASFERIPYGALDRAGFERSLRLNLESPFVLAHRLTPELRRQRGSMVFITCTSATAPYKNYLPYVVSKGALRQLVRTLALELAPEVRVNAVAPGTVLPPEDMDPAVLARLVKKIPLARHGSPEDVAEAVRYLAQAEFVTGNEIVVDGGAVIANSA
ncbi:MAG TPA: SDR family oxidoreductase [Polyangiaceae bacterium]